MMEAAPASTLIVTEPQFLLKVLVVALDPPAQLRQLDHTNHGDVVGQRRQPVFCRLGFAVWPLDHEPFLGPRLRKPIVAVCGASADTGEARDERTGAAFAPCYGLPRLCRKAERQGLGGDRLVLGIAPEQLGPPPTAGPVPRRQRPGP